MALIYGISLKLWLIYLSVLSQLKAQHRTTVPLHAMKALEGRGSVAPTHSWPRH